MLRMNNDMNIDERQSIELRHKYTEIYGGVFVLFIAGVVGITGMLKPPMSDPNESSSALLAQVLGYFSVLYGVFLGYGLSRTKIKADMAGVQWHIHRRNCQVEWAQVKEVHIRQEHNQKGNLISADLDFVNLRSEKVASLQLFLGSYSEKQSFLNFITHRVKVVYEDSSPRT